MNWRDLVTGDTVMLGTGLITLIKKDEAVYTWLLLETGNTFRVTYESDQLHQNVNDGFCRIFARARPT